MRVPDLDRLGPLPPLTVTNPFEPADIPPVAPLAPLSVSPLSPPSMPDGPEMLTGARTAAPLSAPSSLTAAPQLAPPPAMPALTGIQTGGPLIPTLVRIARLVTARDPQPLRRPRVTVGQQTPFDTTVLPEQEYRILTLDCGS